MLPAALRSLFWDYPPDSVNLESDTDLVISRVLAAGSWGAVSWLRRTLGDAHLRSWILDRQGRGLDARRVRFWELILGLPHRQVNAWLRDASRQIWESRAPR